MTQVLVTGCAGFIGSHLAQDLLQHGHAVVGVDSINDFYDRALKRQNLAQLLADPNFTMVDADLAVGELEKLFTGIDVVYHQAGQPGVRTSWKDGFQSHLERNIQVTQRVLEASSLTGVSRLIFASSSSIYGDDQHFPTSESAVPKPLSPYGVSKLAAEHLVSLYGLQGNLTTFSLRYFTVYGPAQRPDMAFSRLLTACADGRPFPLYGDGEQLRDFTYVADVVDANRRAMVADLPSGSCANISGGSVTSMNQVISLCEEITGRSPNIVHAATQRGDVRRTAGDNTRSAMVLGWEPQTDLSAGLSKQWNWICTQQ